MVGGELGREVMGVRAYGKERGRDAGENGSSKYTHTHYISGNTMNLMER